MKEFNFKKIFLSTVIFTAISFVIHNIEAVIDMKYYLDPRHFGVWSQIMMPENGPPPASFFIASIIFTLVTGISVTLIYYYLKDHLPKENKRRIFYFADLMLGTYFVFFTLPVYLMFNVAVGLLVSWFISTFIILTLSSWAMVKIIK